MTSCILIIFLASRSTVLKTGDRWFQDFSGLALLTQSPHATHNWTVTATDRRQCVGTVQRPRVAQQANVFKLTPSLIHDTSFELWLCFANEATELYLWDDNCVNSRRIGYLWLRWYLRIIVLKFVSTRSISLTSCLFLMRGVLITCKCRICVTLRWTLSRRPKVEFGGIALSLQALVKHELCQLSGKEAAARSNPASRYWVLVLCMHASAFSGPVIGHRLDFEAGCFMHL